MFVFKRLGLSPVKRYEPRTDPGGGGEDKSQNQMPTTVSDARLEARAEARSHLQRACDIVAAVAGAETEAHTRSALAAELRACHCLFAWLWLDADELEAAKDAARQALAGSGCARAHNVMPCASARVALSADSFPQNFLTV